jgi:hypothetical protein
MMSNLTPQVLFADYIGSADREMGERDSLISVPGRRLSDGFIG